MSKLTNKVALVTGGSRGIGAAIAKRLAADGASVAITYAKDAGAASTVVKAIEDKGGKAIAIQADSTDPAAIKAAVEKAVAALDTRSHHHVTIRREKRLVCHRYESALEIVTREEPIHDLRGLARVGRARRVDQNPALTQRGRNALENGPLGLCKAFAVLRTLLPARLWVPGGQARTRTRRVDQDPVEANVGVERVLASVRLDNSGLRILERPDHPRQNR